MFKNSGIYLCIKKISYIFTIVENDTIHDFINIKYQYHD